MYVCMYVCMYVDSLHNNKGYFSIEWTKTKVITLANHKARRAIQ